MRPRSCHRHSATVTTVRTAAEDEPTSSCVPRAAATLYRAQRQARAEDPEDPADQQGRQRGHRQQRRDRERPRPPHQQQAGTDGGTDQPGRGDACRRRRSPAGTGRAPAHRSRSPRRTSRRRARRATMTTATVTSMTQGRAVTSRATGLPPLDLRLGERRARRGARHPDHRVTSDHHGPLSHPGAPVRLPPGPRRRASRRPGASADVMAPQPVRRGTEHHERPTRRSPLPPPHVPSCGPRVTASSAASAASSCSSRRARRRQQRARIVSVTAPGFAASTWSRDERRAPPR